LETLDAFEVKHSSLFSPVISGKAMQGLIALTVDTRACTIKLFTAVIIFISY
jgi:hypothetical protein